MEVFCKKAILKTKMGSFFKKATVLRNICEPLLLYVVQADISLSLSLCFSSTDWFPHDGNIARSWVNKRYKKLWRTILFLR